MLSAQHLFRYAATGNKFSLFHSLEKDSSFNQDFLNYPAGYNIL